mmetsp:Transcript_15057/g.44598  ORF Transcript_15057/g.44598 Transcript_15057/m.44598 type:complete len:204 (-) Transcript_15057:6-617(-)
MKATLAGSCCGASGECSRNKARRHSIRESVTSGFSECAMSRGRPYSPCILYLWIHGLASTAASSACSRTGAASATCRIVVLTTTISSSVRPSLASPPPATTRSTLRSTRRASAAAIVTPSTRSLCRVLMMTGSRGCLAGRKGSPSLLAANCSPPRHWRPPVAQERASRARRPPSPAVSSPRNPRQAPGRQARTTQAAKAAFMA